MNKVLVFQEVYLRYDNEYILENVTFEIYEKEVIGIIGPNGAGKTTLVKLILGLITPSFGKVILFGKNPVLSRSKVGYLAQFSTVNKDVPITCYEFVKLAYIDNYSRRVDKRVTEILEILDAYSFKDKLIYELSGGQLQRVLLARALVNDPEMLILDEPTNFIDEKAKQNFYEIIKSFKDQKTIIMVSHDLNMVTDFTDRVICLNRQIFSFCKIQDLNQNLDTIYGKMFKYILHKH